MFDFYVQNEYWFAVVQLILAMMGMGATLAPADFRRVLAEPKAFSVGMGAQFLLVPCFAYLFILLLDDNPGLAVGLAVCAAVPGGTVSNIFTYFARGHVALSITLTAVTTAACLLTTPIILALLIEQHLPASFNMPAARIATEIALTLLLPLALGMLVLRSLPAIAPGFSKWCVRGALLIIALIVIGALGAGRLDLVSFGWTGIGVVLGFITLLALVSNGLPRAFGNSRKDRIAINIEVTVRNTNLGLLIKASLFPAAIGVADPVGDHALFAILAYGGFGLIFSGVMILWFRRDAKQH